MSELRKGAVTSTAIADAMLELVQSRGYAGAGLTAVLERAGAPKGSMYFHFPEGKEELGARAVAIASDQFRSMIDAAATDEPTPGAVVTRVIGLLADMVAESDFQLGCPVAVVTLEMGAHSDRLQSACAAAYESWIAPLEGLLVANGRSAAEARTLAVTVVSSVEGAMVVSRALRDLAPLAGAAQVLAGLLDDPGASTAQERS